MEIIISEAKAAKLTERARAAGYENAEQIIDALIAEPIEDPRGELTPEELRESAAVIARANEEIDAGGGVDAEEAFRQIGKKFGFEFTR